MLLNFCLIVLLALTVSALFEKMRLPGLLGMLIVGVLLGPGVLDEIHPTIIEVSDELRTFALIVILLRAGLGIKRENLNKVGRNALLLSFVPGIFEGTAIIIIAYYMVGLSFYEAGILGFIIAAVSPAVVVPSMLWLKEKGLGENKQISTMILAGASLDDIFAITVFSAFIAMYFGDSAAIGKTILEVPVGILFGIGLGALIGFVLVYIFRKLRIRDTKKVLVILVIAVVFNYMEAYFIMNTLLGIMTIGFILLEKRPQLAIRLSAKFNKVWVLAEIILFVLIGARVDISAISGAGVTGLIIIAVGLIFRSLGVLVTLTGSNLTAKERLFTMMAYTPKATVQAAIGAVPLGMGVASGNYILAVAVLSIIITAPLGAIAIRTLAPRCLEESSN